MKIILSGLKNVAEIIAKSFQRFPITMSSTVLLALLIIYVSEANLSNELSQTMVRVNMSVGLFALGSLCIGLLNEVYFPDKSAKSLLLYVVGLLFSYGYFSLYLSELSAASIMRYTAIMIMLSVTLFFIQRLSEKLNYEAYVMKVLNGLIITAVYSAVLYFGISAIIFTISTLFSIHISGKYYFYSFIVVFLIFAVAIFLSKLPQPDEDFASFVYPDPLRILLLFIVIPLISVYTAILYAYFARILLTSTWPQGLVSHLVLWYSTVSVGVIFLLTPVLSENRIGRLFHKWFPKLILPVLAMMFASIGLRINQYGFTENRYLIVLLGIWVLLVMIYFSFSRRMRNILIPISLAVVILFSSFGPLSSFAVSIRSQNNRIEKLLSENNMLQEGQIVPNPDIPLNQKQEISNILSYFDNVHTLGQVQVLPQDFRLVEMPSVFGFEYRPLYGFPPEEYFYYYSDLAQGPIDVQGYDYFFLINPWNEQNRSVDDIRIDFSLSQLQLDIYQNSSSLIQIDLLPLVQVLQGDLIQNPRENRDRFMPASRMTFPGENSNVKYSISFINISGYYDADDNPVLENLDFVLLLAVQ